MPSLKNDQFRIHKNSTVDDTDQEQLVQNDSRLQFSSLSRFFFIPFVFVWFSLC